MTQTIDPAKLKAAAEHLEWTLKQHLDNQDVKGLLEELTPLLQAAKSQQVSETLDRWQIPGAKEFADGSFIGFDDPNIEEAYYDFSAELRGGRTEQELQLIAQIESMRKEGNDHV